MVHMNGFLFFLPFFLFETDIWRTIISMDRSPRLWKILTGCVNCKFISYSTTIRMKLMLHQFAFLVGHITIVFFCAFYFLTTDLFNVNCF